MTTKLHHPSSMRGALAMLGLAAAPLLVGCSGTPLGRAAQTATGYVSHQLCSAVFVSGLDAQRVYREAIAPVGGVFGPAFSYRVDPAHGEVRATFAGLAESRAIYRLPYGCVNASGTALAGAPAEAAARHADAEPVELGTPALQAALARAFVENPGGPRRNTLAAVVMHRGRVVAERYADGVGVDTALPGWSVSKSLTNALVGVLVRQGRLDMHAPAPIAAWADPADPRHAITPDQLLRMTSGLAAGQSLHDVSPFDPSAQMLFVERDMAAFASAAPLAHAPGTHWNYADPNTLLLSRIVRERAGGEPAKVLEFIHRELLDPIGMRHVTIEFDAAGTPIGSSHAWASARDWARLGQLFLDDGVAPDGTRLLPAGWVDYSARPTPGSEFVGYGAGFWTNRGSGYGARVRIAGGIPADAFMARGSYGQYVVIVPSAQLVVVRLGPAWTERDDMDTVAQLTREAIEALAPVAARPEERSAPSPQ